WIGLGGLSAFWQLIVYVQFYRLLGRLNLSIPSRRVGTFAMLCFFGTNLFNLRYYALSSTPLALVGLFSALIEVDRLLKGYRRPLVLLGPLALIALNHLKQEL